MIDSRGLSEDEVIHILVQDGDGCAWGSQLERPDGLNPEMLQYVADRAPAEKFVGVYFCTARCLEKFETNLWQYVTPKEKLKTKGGATLTVVRSDGREGDVDQAYFLAKLLMNATSAFIRETGLPLLAISTSDDVNCNHCGEAYTKYHLPLEQKVMASLDDAAGYITLFMLEGVRSIRGKQKKKEVQLRQIVEDAARRFPNKKIILTFVDDVFENCAGLNDITKNVAQVSLRPVWYQDGFFRDLHQEIVDKKRIYEGKKRSSLFFEQLFTEKDNHVKFEVKLRGVGLTYEDVSTLTRSYDFHAQLNALSILIKHCETLGEYTLLIKLEGELQNQKVTKEFSSAIAYAEYIAEHFPLEKVTSLQANAHSLSLTTK